MTFTKASFRENQHSSDHDMAHDRKSWPVVRVVVFIGSRQRVAGGGLSFSEIDMKVKRTERGWAGHFVASDSCKFRRNTLLECGDTKIVVSSVGLMKSSRPRHLSEDGFGFDTIGCDRYFETMAFHSNPSDTRFNDADVSRQINFDSPWSIDYSDADDKANDMHETVVDEIVGRLRKGETFS